jgi:hypothetical protein
MQATITSTTRKPWNKVKLNRWQFLLTADQIRSLPPIGMANPGGGGMNANAHVKFFSGGRTWFATEFDPAEGLFYGYCVNHSMPDCSEFGYFAAEELSARQVPQIERMDVARFRMIPVVERDLHFAPKPLREAIAEIG